MNFLYNSTSIVVDRYATRLLTFISCVLLEGGGNIPGKC